MQPIIKYTGSKRHYAAEIAAIFPEYDTAYLPFCGGCSFLPYLDGQVIASDLCASLIAALNTVKNTPETLLDLYSTVRLEYIKDRNFYYKIRNDFNADQSRGDLFYILTRLCFNGLIRWNSEGKFNVSCHFSRDGIEPERLRKVFHSWEQVLSRATFLNEDYRVTFDRAKSGDLVVCDPPYLNTKGQYQNEIFNFSQLWENLELLNSKNVKWVLCLDHGLDLSIIPNIYRGVFHTRELSSSFNRLKLNNIKNGNTILTNYNFTNTK